MRVNREAVLRVLGADGKLYEVTNEEIEAFVNAEYSWRDLLWAAVTSPRYVWLGIVEGFKVARSGGAR